MAKYGDWKLGQIEALINIIGGDKVARAVLSGECGIIVEPKEPPLPRRPVPEPPIVGTLVKTLDLKSNNVRSHKHAIKLGKYDTCDKRIITLFVDDEADLAESMSVDLYQFDRSPSYDEILAWAKGNGDKKPIMPKHIHAIGIQYPEEQRQAPIVALGSVRHGNVFHLYGYPDYRHLDYRSVRHGINCRNDSLFGFISEKPVGA